MDNYEIKYTAEHAVRLQYERAIEENLPADKETILDEAVTALSRMVIWHKDQTEGFNNKAYWEGVADRYRHALHMVRVELEDLRRYKV